MAVRIIRNQPDAGADKQVDFRFRFLIGLLVAVIFCSNAISIFADNAVDPNRIFNMSLYENADQAKDEFLKTYPKGSNICPVLEYLNTNTRKATTPYELRDFTTWGRVKEKTHQWNPFIDDRGFIFMVERPHENMDAWRVHIESNRCRLRDVKVRLQYKDKNFVKRNIPFRFEYFEDTDLIGTVSAYYAANSIASEKEATFKEMEKIFRDAGASEFRAGGGNAIKRIFLMGAQYYPKRKIGSCKPWYVSISTNEDGSLYYKNGVMSPISVNPPHCTTL